MHAATWIKIALIITPTEPQMTGERRTNYSVSTGPYTVSFIAVSVSVAKT